MQVPEPTANFEPAPAGTNTTCFRVIDLGTQSSEFKGESKTQHQIMLSWELANKTTKAGKPVTISKTLNFSMHEMATMRSFVEAMMSRTFRKEDLYGKDRFDIRHLLGRPCLLTIQHVELGDKLSAKIIACVPVPEGMTAPQTISANIFLSLDPGLFDQDTFDGPSDWAKTKIKESPEYQDLMGIATKPANVRTAELINDEIPF